METQKPVLRRVMGFLKPYRKEYLARIFFTVLNAVMGIVALAGSSLVIRAATEGSYSDLYTGIALLVGGLVLEGVSPYVSGRLMARFVLGAVADIKNQAVAKLNSLPTRYYDQNHSGETASRLSNDIAVMQKYLQDQPTNYVYFPVRFIVSFTVLVLVNWQLTLACCAIIPFAVFVPQYMGRRIEQRAKHLQEGLGKTNILLQDVLAGVATVKAYTMHRTLEPQFDEANGQAHRDARALTRFRTHMDISGTIFYMLPTILCILLGGWMTLTGRLALYQLSFFVLMLDYLLEPVERLPRILAAWKTSKAACVRVLELLDTPGEQEGNAARAAQGGHPIEAKDLRFSYGSEPVLRGACFVVPQNQITALVGPSGCGKSTLLSLLCGLYDGYEGSLRILGSELREWRLDALRANMSMVGQDAFLFGTTVYENIALGREGATRQQVEEAAKKANAHEFILELEKGYDTYVGERGARLSGGQRQRITIARAILKDAPLLFLDEPTSALDVEAEAQVQLAIDKLLEGKTVVVVAHRMSTIKNAQQVLVMEHGHIVAGGTHTELMRECALYQTLYQREAGLLGSTEEAEDDIG